MLRHPVSRIVRAIFKATGSLALVVTSLAHCGFALGYRQAFPDLQTTTDDMISEGEKVVVRWTMSATHQGETEAFGPPTGKRMKITGITIRRFEAGKIVEGWTIADTLGQMQQLGMGSGPDQPVEN